VDASAQASSDTLSILSSGWGKLKVTAYVSDEISIKDILDELGLSPAEGGEAAADPIGGQGAGGPGGAGDSRRLRTGTFFDLASHPGRR